MSTTTNLGLFKHDNSGINKEQFDVDKALNQNWDKTDKAFGEDRERLDLLEASNTIYNFKGKADTLNTIKSKTATKGDVWYCIEDSTYYAYNGTDWIPVNLNLKLEVIDELQAKTIKVLQEVETPTPVSGENIDITDSAEAKITELNISGNSKQKTSVEGKNKFDSKNVSYYTRDSRETYIINSSNSITVNGTEYSWTRISITIPNLKPSTEYTISAKVTNASNHNAGFLIEDDNNVVRSISTNANFTSKITFITDSNGSITIQVFSNWSGTVLTESVTYDDIQLEEGETVTEYEEFEPNMPSSNYPSEVESCGDNVNLFDMPESATSNGIALTKNKDGTANIKGTSTATAYFAKFVKIEDINLKAGKTYPLVSSTNNTNISYRIEAYNETTWISTLLSNTNNSAEITIPENTTQIRYYVSVASGLTVNYSNVYIKLEKGSKATPYSPFGQGCINEVICNENLFDGINRNYYINTGATLAGVAESDIGGYVDVSKLEQVTISSISVQGRFRVGLTNELSNSMTLNSGINLDSNTSKKTTIDTTNYKYLIINANNLNVIKVEKGSEAKEYVAHQSQIYTISTQQPMRSVEEIRDTFIKKNNKWYERHLVKRVIFDGTESWSLGTEGFFRTIHENLPSSPVLCNQLNNAKTYQEILEGGAGFIYSSLQNLYMNFSKYITFTTVDEFKTYLAEQYNAGTPVYVDYVLAEPIDIECTEEQSEILWDIDQKAKTYDKVTHMYSTDEISPVIEVTYKKDIETLFANTLVEEV